jgi:hypothetical protein
MADVQIPNPSRNITTCVTCGQTDDHPKCHFVDIAIKVPFGGGESVAQVISGPIRHMDCCPCDTCVRIIGNAGGRRGFALLDYITSNPPELLAAHEGAGIFTQRNAPDNETQVML